MILDHWDHSSSKDLINRCPIPLMHNDPSDLGSLILIQITFKRMYHKRRWRVRELMSQVSLISKVTRPQFISGSVAAPEIPGGSKTPERATRIYYLFTHSHSLTYVESPACSTNTVMIKFRSLLSISAPLRMRFFLLISVPIQISAPIPFKYYSAIRAGINGGSSSYT